MSKTSITFKLNVIAAGAYPVWRTGMVPWQWKEITGTSMNGVNTSTITLPAGNSGPSSRINTWAGLAANPATGIIYAAANGGHADYYGNEVVAIPLATDTPTWSIIRQASAFSQVQSDASHYLDGRPSSSHTYYGCHFMPSLGRVVRIGSGYVYGGGVSMGASYGFDISTGDWDGAGTYPNTSWPAPNPYVTGGVCQDKNTGDIYLTTNAAMQRLSASKALSSPLAAIAGVNGDVANNRPLVYDHTRSRALLVGDAYSTNSGQLWTNDGGNGSWARITFTGADAGGLGGGSAYGAHYDATLDRVLVKQTTGAGVLSVHPTTFVSTQQTTTGGGSMPDAINGVFGRFLPMPLLKGYAYYPAYTSNIWFLATE